MSASELRYRRLFETARDGILILDAETGIVVDVNPFLLDLLDYPVEEFRGKAIWEQGSFKDIVANRDSFAELQRNEYIRYEDKPMEDSTGQRHEVEFISSVYLVNHKNVIQCNIRDITGRKLVLEEARRMATMVRDSNDAITIQDFEGRITAWNRGAERMFGYSEAEALQMTIWQLAPPDKAAEQKDFNHRIFAGEKVSSFETQRLTKAGRVLDVWMTVTKLVDDAGTPIGIASTERDITERKLAEVELDAVNHELEAFSYSVSHDLKAPLRAVDGFTKMLEEDYADRLDDEGRRLLKVVRDSAREMGQLVNDLLAFSRLSRKDLIMTQLDLGRMAEDACRQVELDAEGRTLRWEIGDLPPVFGDEATIREVLVNLLSNAVKFTRPREEAVIGFAGHAEAGEVVCTVTDNGVGFDMTYKDKLFSVFQRLHTADKFEGTGIGLALVQRIIKRHGGRVWAEGEVDKGARFSFTLPRDGESGNDPKKTEERQ